MNNQHRPSMLGNPAFPRQRMMMNNQRFQTNFVDIQQRGPRMTQPSCIPDQHMNGVDSNFQLQMAQCNMTVAMLLARNHRAGFGNSSGLGSDISNSQQEFNSNLRNAQAFANSQGFSAATAYSQGFGSTTGNSQGVGLANANTPGFVSGFGNQQRVYDQWMTGKNTANSHFGSSNTFNNQIQSNQFGAQRHGQFSVQNPNFPRQTNPNRSILNPGSSNNQESVFQTQSRNMNNGQFETDRCTRPQKWNRSQNQMDEFQAKRSEPFNDYSEDGARNKTWNTTLQGQTEEVKVDRVVTCRREVTRSRSLADQWWEGDKETVTVQTRETIVQRTPVYEYNHTPVYDEDSSDARSHEEWSETSRKTNSDDFSTRNSTSDKEASSSYPSSIGSRLPDSFREKFLTVKRLLEKTADQRTLSDEASLQNKVGQFSPKTSEAQKVFWSSEDSQSSKEHEKPTYRESPMSDNRGQSPDSSERFRKSWYGSENNTYPRIEKFPIIYEESDSEDTQKTIDKIIGYRPRRSQPDDYLRTGKTSGFEVTSKWDDILEDDESENGNVKCPVKPIRSILKKRKLDHGSKLIVEKQRCPSTDYDSKMIVEKQRCPSTNNDSKMIVENPNCSSSDYSAEKKLWKYWRLLNRSSPSSATKTRTCLSEKMGTRRSVNKFSRRFSESNDLDPIKTDSRSLTNVQQVQTTEVNRVTECKNTWKTFKSSSLSLLMKEYGATEAQEETLSDSSPRKLGTEISSSKGVDHREVDEQMLPRAITLHQMSQKATAKPFLKAKFNNLSTNVTPTKAAIVTTTTATIATPNKSAYVSPNKTAIVTPIKTVIDDQNRNLTTKQVQDNDITNRSCFVSLDQGHVSPKRLEIPSPNMAFPESTLPTESADTACKSQNFDLSQKRITKEKDLTVTIIRRGKSGDRTQFDIKSISSPVRRRTNVRTCILSGRTKPGSVSAIKSKEKTATKRRCRSVDSSPVDSKLLKDVRVHIEDLNFRKSKPPRMCLGDRFATQQKELIKRATDSQKSESKKINRKMSIVIEENTCHHSISFDNEDAAPKRKRGRPVGSKKKTKHVKTVLIHTEVKRKPGRPKKDKSFERHGKKSKHDEKRQDKDPTRIHKKLGRPLKNKETSKLPSLSLKHLKQKITLSNLTPADVKKRKRGRPRLETKTREQIAAYLDENLKSSGSENSPKWPVRDKKKMKPLTESTSQLSTKFPVCRVTPLRIPFSRIPSSNTGDNDGSHFENVDEMPEMGRKLRERKSDRIPILKVAQLKKNLGTRKGKAETTKVPVLKVSELKKALTWTSKAGTEKSGKVPVLKVGELKKNLSGSNAVFKIPEKSVPVLKVAELKKSLESQSVEDEYIPQASDGHGKVPVLKIAELKKDSAPNQHMVTPLKISGTTVLRKTIKPLKLSAVSSDQNQIEDSEVIDTSQEISEDITDVPRKWTVSSTETINTDIGNKRGSPHASVNEVFVTSTTGRISSSEDEPVIENVEEMPDFAYDPESEDGMETTNEADVMNSHTKNYNVELDLQKDKPSLFSPEQQSNVDLPGKLETVQKKIRSTKSCHDKDVLVDLQKDKPSLFSPEQESNVDPPGKLETVQKKKRSTKSCHDKDVLVDLQKDKPSLFSPEQESNVDPPGKLETVQKKRRSTKSCHDKDIFVDHPFKKPKEVMLYKNSVAFRKSIGHKLTGNKYDSVHNDYDIETEDACNNLTSVFSDSENSTRENDNRAETVATVTEENIHCVISELRKSKHKDRHSHNKNKFTKHKLSFKCNGDRKAFEHEDARLKDCERSKCHPKHMPSSSSSSNEIKYKHSKYGKIKSSSCKTDRDQHGHKKHACSNSVTIATEQIQRHREKHHKHKHRKGHSESKSSESIDRQRKQPHDLIGGHRKQPQLIGQPRTESCESNALPRISFNMIQGDQLTQPKLRFRSCPYCRSFSTRLDHIMQEHVKTAHAHKCITCKIAFRNPMEARAHRLTRHLQEVHHCMLCRQAFTTQHHYNKHIVSRAHTRLVEAQREAIDAICGVFFNSGSEDEFAATLKRIQGQEGKLWNDGMVKGKKALPAPGSETVPAPNLSHLRHYYYDNPELQKIVFKFQDFLKAQRLSFSSREETTTISSSEEDTFFFPLTDVEQPESIGFTSESESEASSMKRREPDALLDMSISDILGAAMSEWESEDGSLQGVFEVGSESTNTIQSVKTDRTQESVRFKVAETLESFEVSSESRQQTVQSMTTLSDSTDSQYHRRVAETFVDSSAESTWFSDTDDVVFTSFPQPLMSKPGASRFCPSHDRVLDTSFEDDDFLAPLPVPMKPELVEEGAYVYAESGACLMLQRKDSSAYGSSLEDFLSSEDSSCEQNSKFESPFLPFMPKPLTVPEADNKVDSSFTSNISPFVHPKEFVMPQDSQSEFEDDVSCNPTAQDPTPLVPPKVFVMPQDSQSEFEDDVSCNPITQDPTPLVPPKVFAMPQDSQSEFEDDVSCNPITQDPTPLVPPKVFAMPQDSQSEFEDDVTCHPIANDPTPLVPPKVFAMPQDSQSEFEDDVSCNPIAQDPTPLVPPKIFAMPQDSQSEFEDDVTCHPIANDPTPLVPPKVFAMPQDSQSEFEDDVTCHPNAQDPTPLVPPKVFAMPQDSQSEFEDDVTCHPNAQDPTPLVPPKVFAMPQDSQSEFKDDVSYHPIANDPTPLVPPKEFVMPQDSQSEFKDDVSYHPTPLVPPKVFAMPQDSQSEFKDDVTCHPIAQDPPIESEGHISSHLIAHVTIETEDNTSSLPVVQDLPNDSKDCVASHSLYSCTKFVSKYGNDVAEIRDSPTSTDEICQKSELMHPTMIQRESNDENNHKSYENVRESMPKRDSSDNHDNAVCEESVVSSSTTVPERSSISCRNDSFLGENATLETCEQTQSQSTLPGIITVTDGSNSENSSSNSPDKLYPFTGESDSSEPQQGDVEETSACDDLKEPKAEGEFSVDNGMSVCGDKLSTKEMEIDPSPVKDSFTSMGSNESRHASDVTELDRTDLRCSSVQQKENHNMAEEDVRIETVGSSVTDTGCEMSESGLSECEDWPRLQRMDNLQKEMKRNEESNICTGYDASSSIFADNHENTTPPKVCDDDLDSTICYGSHGNTTHSVVDDKDDSDDGSICAGNATRSSVCDDGRHSVQSGNHGYGVLVCGLPVVEEDRLQEEMNKLLMKLEGSDTEDFSDHTYAIKPS